MLKILAIAGLLLGAPVAYSQTVASCPTATPGSTWNPKTQWLECSDLTYIAEPVPATSLINDMRCNGACVFSWVLPTNVLPTDQTWVKTTAKPNGEWVPSSTLKLTPRQCSTLIYIGAPLTITNRLGGAPPPFGAPVNGPPWSIGNPVVGMIQLNAPLPPSATTTYPVGSNALTPGAVVAWDFTSEYPPFITGSPYYTSVTFTTDANDNITDWNFVVEYYDFLSSGGGFDSITSTPAGDTVTIEPAGADFQQVWFVTGISKAPGKWRCLSAFDAHAHL
jgi:hypothetical protein